MKIAYRAADITEAEIVKSMLLSHDIESHVSGYYLQGGIGDLAPTDLAKVHVPDEDYEEARKLITAYEGNQTEQTGLTDTTERPETPFPQKFLVTIIIAIAISVLSFWIGF